MQVFNCIMKIIKKNLLALSIYFFLFMALVLIFTNAPQGVSLGSFSDTTLSITVLNRDNSPLGESIKDYMGTRHTLVNLPDEKERLQDELFYRNIEYILIIPEGFEKAVSDSPGTAVVENIKVPDSTTGVYVDMQVDQYIKSLVAYREAGYSIEEAVQSANQDMSAETAVEMISESSDGQTPTVMHFYRYLPYIFLAILVTGLGRILIVFNDKNIQRRNQCSSMKLRSMNLQLIGGCILFALFCWAVFVAVSCLLYTEYIFTTTGMYLILNSLATVLCALSLSYLAGVFMKGPNALPAISNTLGLGMSFLGGVFVPQSALNENILNISRLFPTYWYMRALDTLNAINVFDSESLRPVHEGILVQFGFAIAFFAVALVASHQKKMHPSRK